MGNLKDVTKMSMFSRRLVVAIVAVAVSAALGGAALGASSPRKHRGWASVFSVLSHASISRARAKAADVPQGAVLAAETGTQKVYAWQGTKRPGGLGKGQEICLFDHHAGGDGGGGSCGPAGAVALHGVVGIQEIGESLYRTVTVMVPDGVSTVSFTDRDGKTYPVDVKNNVVVVEDQELASPPTTAVSYSLPNGTTEAISMPAPPVK